MIKHYLKRRLDDTKRNKYKTLNTIYVHKAALAHNVNVFKKLHPDKSLIAVLKSNAYGHGLKQTAMALNETAIDFIAVDGYFEADRIIPYTNKRILVMGYVLPENAGLLDPDRCSFVVQDIEGLRALAEQKSRFNVHMEINTGMNRLGLQPEEVEEYLTELAKHSNLKLEGVMSHLADADNPDESYTLMQTAKFEEVVKLIKSNGYSPKYIHIAQSAGSTKRTGSLANAIRLGIGLYGINPLQPSDPNFQKLDDLMPALELKSTIIKVIDLEPGEKISYNGLYETTKTSRIGVLPLGYYEWVPRELSNKGVFTAKGQKLPIRGRVCMNHTMIDLTDTDLKGGDQVTVINLDQTQPNSIEAIAEEHKLFSYNLLTRMAESVRRELV